MPPHSFRLEKSSGFCHPASIPTRPSFLGCHNWRQISGVLEGRWRFTESLYLMWGGFLHQPGSWYTCFKLQCPYYDLPPEIE